MSARSCLHASLGVFLFSSSWAFSLPAMADCLRLLPMRDAGHPQRQAAYRAATDKGHRELAVTALREVRYLRARRASAEVVKPPAQKRGILRYHRHPPQS